MFLTKSLIISYVCITFKYVFPSLNSLLTYNLTSPLVHISHIPRLKIVMKFWHISLHIINKFTHPFFFHKSFQLCPFIGQLPASGFISSYPNYYCNLLIGFPLSTPYIFLIMTLSREKELKKIRVLSFSTDWIAPH